MDAKQRKSARQLHRLCGSDNDAEATAARRKLIELLRAHGKTWNDIDAILAEDTPPPTYSDPRDDTPPAEDGFTNFTVGDLLHGVLPQHIGLHEHEYVAV